MRVVASLFHDDVSTQCGVNRHNEDYAGSGRQKQSGLQCEKHICIYNFDIIKI